MIAIVDYGMGNIRSLRNALDCLGADVSVTSRPEDLARAERIVLPGVGAFGDAMNAIRERGLDESLDGEVRRKGKPFLGICLGMQLLAKSSNEHGRHAGLGWLDAEVERFELPGNFKVPHIGWNDIEPGSDPLFQGLDRSESNFYFVHSYHMRCARSADVIARADYGGPFTAAVRAGNVVATQFHPEKSQDNGMLILRNFMRWNS